MADPTEDAMNLCFICNEKLVVGYTQLASSTLPYSHLSYLERVAGLLGESFVLIVNSADNMCLKCTSLLNHIDKLENDMENAKTIIMSDIQKKYCPEVVKRTETDKMLNEQTADKRLKACQIKVQSGSIIKTVSIKPVKTPITFRKIQLQPRKKTEQIQIHQQNNANRLVSVRRVQFRTLTSSNKRRPVSNLSPAIKILTPIPTPRSFYTCKLCFKPFYSRFHGLQHIRKDHKKRLRSSAFKSTSVKIEKTVKESIKLPDPEEEEVHQEEEEEVRQEEEEEVHQEVEEEVHQEVKEEVRQEEEEKKTKINEAIKNPPINISDDIKNDPTLKRVFVFM